MKWLRHLLRGASLTAALFVFQACYGTPPAPPSDDIDVAAVVRSETDAESAEADPAAETPESGAAEE